jgi:hypothetical protein
MTASFREYANFIWGVADLLFSAAVTRKIDARGEVAVSEEEGRTSGADSRAGESPSS